MFHRTKLPLLCRIGLLCCLLPLVALPARAASAAGTCGGIFITALPDDVALCLSGERALRAGDAVSLRQLPQLRAVSLSDTSREISISYLPIFSGEAGPEQTQTLFLRGSKNTPPTAQDLSLRTYKNLPLQAALRGADPDGDTLRFSIIRPPKRGNVTLQEDGTFTYTPDKNKVGTDCFYYQAADSAGNRSGQARVTIEIEKPVCRGSFADMQHDPQAYEAMFLRNAGLFSGEQIGGTLCFCPDKPVSSQEFLIMLMKLTRLAPEASCQDAASQDWFSPWQSAALRAGFVYTPAEQMQRGDAVLLVAGALDLPACSSLSVSSCTASPSEPVLCAMQQAGLPCFADSLQAPLRRRDAAVLLCAVSAYCENEAVSFPWDAS